MDLHLILQIIFWLLAGLFIIPFAIYPALMALIGRLIPSVRFEERVTDDDLPEVTIIVAAYNEEQGIRATIQSLLEQDYPEDKILIKVFSDGSVDDTDRLVRGLAEEHSQVSLTRFERRGKTECQNLMVEKTNSEILAFCDGGATWQQRTLRSLVEPMVRSGNVAVTTGRLVLQRAGSDDVNLGNEGLFRKVDEIIKRGESALKVTIGVNGPVYAVRRNQYVRLNAAMVSDLALPVLVLARGKRVVHVARAIAHEASLADVWQDFARKRRIITQGLVSLGLLSRAVLAARRPLLVVAFFGHKVLRWFGSVLALAALIISFMLWPNPLYVWLDIIVAGFVMLSGIGLALMTDGKRAGLLKAPAYFVLGNLASLAALTDYARGKRKATWQQ